MGKFHVISGQCADNVQDFYVCAASCSWIRILRIPGLFQVHSINLDGFGANYYADPSSPLGCGWIVPPVQCSSLHDDVAGSFEFYADIVIKDENETTRD